MDGSSGPVMISLLGSFPSLIMAGVGTMVAMVGVMVIVILSDQMGRSWLSKS